jgi:sugar lactone lactonase YvrE
MTVRHSVERIQSKVVSHSGVGPITLWPVANKVGESPIWSLREQALYWIDVRAPQLLRLQPDTGELTRWHLPSVVGAMALVDDGDVLLAFAHGLVRMNPKTGVLSDIAAVEEDQPHNRLNDGKASPSGRWFVFGSMDDRTEKASTGALYRASMAGDVVQLMDGLTVANGIAWNLEGTRIYFSDSHRGQVYVAPWDEQTGVMGTSRLFLALDEAAGRPDGAAVDDEDCYWSAGVSAGVLHRISPTGDILSRIQLPCRAPTMCAFGGADSATVFVTSLIRPTWVDPGPMEGALLSFHSTVPGSPCAACHQGHSWRTNKSTPRSTQDQAGQKNPHEAGHVE